MTTLFDAFKNPSRVFQEFNDRVRDAYHKSNAENAGSFGQIALGIATAAAGAVKMPDQSQSSTAGGAGFVVRPGNSEQATQLPRRLYITVHNSKRKNPNIHKTELGKSEHFDATHRVSKARQYLTRGK